MILSLLGCVFISENSRDSFLASFEPHSGPPDTDTAAPHTAEECDTEITLWRDQDDDGAGDPAVSKLACGPEPGWVTNDDDCDDANEYLTGLLTNYLDADDDGYGTPDTTAEFCYWHDDYSTNDQDCDDANAEISPGALEPCWSPTIDYDCDGDIGECSLYVAGTVLVGETEGGLAGTAAAFVDTLGDDVFGDVAVGIPGVLAPGEVRVVRGRARPADPGDYQALSLADADSVWTSENVGDLGGTALVSADFTGDGTRDLVVGAPYGDPYGLWAGQIVLFEGPLPAGNLTPQRMVGGDDAGDELGQVLTTGNVNDDRYDDIVVGGRWADNSGAAYVFEGPIDLIVPDGSAYDLYTVAGVKVVAPESYDDSGFGAAVALGDLDGDGRDDLVIGHPGSDVWRPDAGGGWICLGALSGDLYAEDCDAQFAGVIGGDAAGSAVAVGDLDGDGWGDILVGAPNADAPDQDVGAVYVLRGGRDAWLDTISLLDAYSTITGQGADNPGGGAGSAVTIPGDITYDGYVDLVIGAPSYDDHDQGPDVGGAWFVAGPVTPGPTSLDDATDRYLCEFSSGSVPGGCAAGAWLGGGGDFDGDGFLDTLVGATGWSDGEVAVGATAIVFGSDIW